MNKELFIIRGIPGSGKSTLAKSLGGKHVEADMFHINKNGVYDWRPEKVKEAHSWCQNQVGEWMSNEEERIVVSNTFIEEWEMQPYFNLAQKYGYKVFSIIIENRHGGESIHNVPKETLEKMKKRFNIKL